MANFIIKQHDTKIRFTDTPKLNGQPISEEDLAGCTVSFLLGNDTWKVKRDAQISGAQFVYDAIPEDVSQCGYFRQEWELRDATGKLLTFPNNGYNVIQIVRDIG